MYQKYKTVLSLYFKDYYSIANIKLENIFYILVIFRICGFKITNINGVDKYYYINKLHANRLILGKHEMTKVARAKLSTLVCELLKQFLEQNIILFPMKLFMKKINFKKNLKYSLLSK